MKTIILIMLLQGLKNVVYILFFSIFHTVKINQHMITACYYVLGTFLRDTVALHL